MKSKRLKIAAAFVIMNTFALPLCGQSRLQVDPTFTPTTITALILDDGIHTHEYMGDVDAGIPATLSIPLYYISDGNTRSTEVPFAGVSSPFIYNGPRELTFFRSPPSPDPDAPLPPRAGEVVLPQDASDVILIFITENFNARKFQIMALDDSPQKFPQNSARAYNFSSAPIALQLGNDSLSINPNQLKWIQMDPTEPFQRVRIARLEDNGQWVLAYNRYTRVRNGHRMTYLIFDAPNRISNQIMVRRIQDPVNVRQQNILQPEEPEL